MQTPSSIRLAWVANLPAPYRIPVWAELERLVPTQAYVMEDHDPRGVRDWALPESGVPSIVNLRCRYVRQEHATVFFPNRRLLRVAGAHDVVVMGAWNTPAFLALLAQCKLRRRPVILFYESTLHSHRHNRGPVASLRRMVLGAVDTVLTSGPSSSASASAAGVREHRIVEGFNPVDGDFYARTATDAVAPTTPHRFLYVGQLIERKNVATLIDALASLSFAWRLSIAGEGPEEESLRQRCGQRDVSGAVDFLGHLGPDALRATYMSHHTLVLPSTTEVWGLVANEGLAAGLQLVVSERCGVVGSVSGMPGVFVVTPDHDSLSAALGSSARSWRGPIPDPQILGRSPRALAELIVQTADQIVHYRHD